MEWTEFELEPPPGKEHFAHHTPGYNPSAFAPGQTDQVTTEAKMRQYGHKPWYPPFNKQDLQRQQKILKREREHGRSEVDEKADAKESLQHIVYINSLRPKPLGYWHTLLGNSFSELKTRQ